MSHVWGSIESLLYFLLLAGAFFLMMRFGCGAHVHGHAASGSGPPETATDPVCSMTVATRGANTSVHDGTTYFFCSTPCRETFDASPERYVKAKPAPRPHNQEEHRHG